MTENISRIATDILRWSERYTNLDMVYVARGGFWITFAQVISSLLSLLLIVAFANLLPKETYGLYRYILSLAGIFGIFSLTGMNNAVARAVAVGQEGAFQDSVKYQLKWNLMMLTAFMALGGYYLVQGNSLFAVSFFILGLFTPATQAFNTYGSYLEGKKEFGLASIFSIVSTFVYTAGMLLVLFLGADVFWLIFVYSGLTLLSTFIFYALTLRIFKPSQSSSGETLQYGRQLTFLGFIDPIASQIDKIVVAHFWGTAQLATYTLAMAIPARATIIIKSLVGLGSPKFANKTPEEINQAFYKRLFQGMLLGALAAGAYILIAPHLFKYVLPRYLDSVFYSQILAISLIFAMPNRLVSLLLTSQKFTKFIFLNSITQNLLRITLYTILGIWGGVFGLVLAFVLHSFIGMLANIAIWQFGSRA
ncbi:MAG: oligosaccharide flippase family protein [Patescibacteria group bacterium]